MKIVFLGNVLPSLDKTYSWYIRTMSQGLRILGHNVCGIDFKTNSPEVIKKKLIELNPSIVLTHMVLRGNIHPLEKMLPVLNDCRKHGMKIIHSMQDAKLDPEYNKKISGAFDCALIGHRNNLKKLCSLWGVPVVYFPQSSMTYKEMSSSVPKYEYQRPIFLGSPNTHKDRKDFINKLRKIMRFGIIQTKSSQDIRNVTWEFSASAKCILGLCTGYNIDGYSDARIWQYLGAGGFLIQRKFLNIDKVIPDDLYIPFFGYGNKDAEYVKEMVDKHISSYNLEIRERAFKYMQQNHSSVVRANNMVKYIMGEQNFIVPKFNGVYV